MFDRFRPEARDVVVSAQGIARELGHREIGDQHILLALLGSTGTAGSVLRSAGADPVALRAVLAGRGNHDADALTSLGIDLEEVRRRAESTFGPGALDRPSPRRRGRLSRWLAVDHLPFTRDAKRTLENALRARRELGHHDIGSEHILLGLLDIEGSAGVRALHETGVGLDRQTAREAVRVQLGRSA